MNFTYYYIVILLEGVMPGDTHSQNSSKISTSDYGRKKGLLAYPTIEFESLFIPVIKCTWYITPLLEDGDLMNGDLQMGVETVLNNMNVTEKVEEFLKKQEQLYEDHPDENRQLKFGEYKEVFPKVWKRLVHKYIGKQINF